MRDHRLACRSGEWTSCMRPPHVKDASCIATTATPEVITTATRIVRKSVRLTLFVLEAHCMQHVSAIDRKRASAMGWYSPSQWRTYRQEKLDVAARTQQW